jgi:hypothetical protein
LPNPHIWDCPDETISSSFGHAKLYHKALKETPWKVYLPNKTAHDYSNNVKPYVMTIMNSLTGGSLVKAQLDVCRRLRDIKEKMEPLIAKQQPVGHVQMPPGFQPMNFSVSTKPKKSKYHLEAISNTMTTSITHLNGHINDGPTILQLAAYREKKIGGHYTLLTVAFEAGVLRLTVKIVGTATTGPSD